MEDYGVKRFLEDCYQKAEEQGAYELTKIQSVKASIQAFRYILRDVYLKHGADMVIQIVTSFTNVEDIKRFKEKFDIGI